MGEPHTVTAPIISVTGSPALLIGRVEAARLSAVSPASWDRLTSAGKNPRPIKLGGRVVWQRNDLETWINLGCLDRQKIDILTQDERR